MPTDQIDYSHADTGTKPSAPQDAQSGEAADPELYDWFVNTFVTKINSLASDVSDILDGTLTVGEADAVDGWDKADIKGWVNQSADVPNADHADSADVADNATAYKGTDLDSDGDGKVDVAVQADNADKLDGEDGSYYKSVPIQFPDDKSNDRTNDTWYTNNTGGPIHVRVIKKSYPGGSSQLQLYLRDSSHSKTLVDENGDRATTDNPGGDAGISVEYMVPDGAEYRIENSGWDKWLEQKLS